VNPFAACSVEDPPFRKREFPSGFVCRSRGTVPVKGEPRCRLIAAPDIILPQSLTPVSANAALGPYDDVHIVNRRDLAQLGRRRAGDVSRMYCCCRAVPNEARGRSQLKPPPHDSGRI